MDDFQYRFTAPLSKLDFGRMAYDVVYLPEELVERLPFAKGKRLRIDGSIFGTPINAAIMPSGGRFYLLISQKIQKACRIESGDEVEVRFDVADPDQVDVPIELQHALAANAEAAEKWQALTAGKKRSICYRVASAKRVETKELRIYEVIDELL